MLLVLILVVVILLYPQQYLLISRHGCIPPYIELTHDLDLLFFPFLERDVVWNVRVEFATKTLLPWRTDILLPFKRSLCD